MIPQQIGQHPGNVNMNFGGPGNASELGRKAFEILKSFPNNNPRPWHSQVTPNDRLTVIINITTSLRLVRVDVQQDQALNIAANYENNVFTQAPDAASYHTQCRQKLLQIRENRQRQMADNEMLLRANQAGQPPSGAPPGGIRFPGQGQPGMPPRPQSQMMMQSGMQQMMPQGQPRPMTGQQLQQPTPAGQFMGQVPGMPQIPQGQPQVAAQRPTINISPQQQNQFIQSMMKKLAEQMGQQMIAQLNNNPPEQLRAAAQAQKMAPAAFYLKQQAFTLFRQKVQQAQQQQAQQQGLNLQRQPGPQPGQLQQQMPPQQQNVRPPPPVPSPAMNRQQPGMPNAHGQQQGTFSDVYQDQAVRAQNAAASGAEVVPASSLPQNMTPTQMQQVMAAQNHARQFSTPTNVPQALSNINRPLSQPAGANGLQPGLNPQQQQQMQPGQAPTPQPGQITPAQIINMMPDTLKEKFSQVPHEQRNQFLQQYLKSRMMQQAQQRNNAAGLQRPPSGQMGNQLPRPASVSQMPGGAPQQATQQATQQPPLPPMPAGFSLSSQQIAVLDTKECNSKLFGPAVASQIPPTVKTWGDVKNWARVHQPQLSEPLRVMQLKMAWNQQAQVMRMKGLLQGANSAAATQPAQGQRPSQPQIMQPTLSPQQLQMLVNMQKEGRQLTPQQLASLNQNIQIYQHNQRVQKAAQAARAANATPQQLQQLQKPPGPSPIPVGKPIPQPSQQQPNMTLAMPPNSGPQQQVMPVAAPQQQQQQSSRPQSTVPMGQQQPGAGLTLNDQQMNTLFETITKMMDEERKNVEVTKKPVVPLSDEEKQRLKEQFNDQELKNMLKRINQLIPMFAYLKGPLQNARDLARAQQRLSAQYKPFTTEPVDEFTVTLKEVGEMKQNINRFFSYVKGRMQQVQQQTQGNAATTKLLQHQISTFSGRFAAHLQSQDNIRKAQYLQAQQRQAQPSQNAQQPELNADNLQRLQQQVQKERGVAAAVLAQKFPNAAGPGSHLSSPDGSPLTFKPRIRPEDLRLPIIDKKRKRPISGPIDPSQSGAGTSAKRSSSRDPPATPQHHCPLDDCGKVCSSPEELAEHNRQHEEQRKHKVEQEARNQHRQQDPIGYAINAVAEFFHIKQDQTSDVKLEDQKPLQQQPTPPQAIQELQDQPHAQTADVWQTPGSPMAARQCFEGLELQGGLANLDAYLFTPAYTPEEMDFANSGAEASTNGNGGNKEDEVNSAAAKESYNDWNPYGFKDVAGSEVLEALDWDMVEMPQADSGLDKDWAMENGFVLVS